MEGRKAARARAGAEEAVVIVWAQLAINESYSGSEVEFAIVPPVMCRILSMELCSEVEDLDQWPMRS